MTLADGEFFKVAEFACHDPQRTPYPEAWDDRWVTLVKLCDSIRRMWGGPLSVVSGYRTQAYNDGLLASGHHPAANSQHIQGMAADLAPTDASKDVVAALHEMVLRAHAVGQLPQLGGLGLYDGWIHVDTMHAPDGHLRRWDMRG